MIHGGAGRFLFVRGGKFLQGENALKVEPSFCQHQRQEFFRPLRVQLLRGDVILPQPEFVNLSYACEGCRVAVSRFLTVAS